jgi:hypothetical protein
MSNIEVIIKDVHGINLIDLPAYQLSIILYLLKEYGVPEVSNYIEEVIKNVNS